MAPGTEFSRIALPDGTEMLRPNSFESTDWRNLRYETAQVQVLVNTPGTQVTVPATLINHAGPGVYDLVVERPGLSVPATDAKLSALIVVLLVPALVAMLALRNLRRLVRTMAAAPQDIGGTSRAGSTPRVGNSWARSSRARAGCRNCRLAFGIRALATRLRPG